jgi:hypothetical protein
VIGEDMPAQPGGETPAAPEQTLEQLGAEVVELKRWLDAARVRLFDRMIAAGAARVDVAGGRIVLAAAHVSHPVDMPALEQKLTRCVEQLRELGVTELDDAIPRGAKPVPPALRVTLT